MRRPRRVAGDAPRHARVPPRPTRPHAVRVLQPAGVLRPPALFYNVTMDEMAAAAGAEVTAGRPVWFACEFEHSRFLGQGLLHHELVAYADAIGEGVDPDVAFRLRARAARPDHAMLLVGLHEEEDEAPADGGGAHARPPCRRRRVARWRVQNSYGEADGAEGAEASSQCPTAGSARTCTGSSSAARPRRPTRSCSPNGGRSSTSRRGTSSRSSPA